MDKNLRLYITVSPANMELLKRWGEFHGKTPSELAGQIVASRLEADIDTILKLDEKRADLASSGRDVNPEE
ncbi:MAG: hypothetical protein PUP93_28555 [Rhizonema sp. NSF051]|nr:hypothetical protein [Rhizonema sp. NSF051]